MAKFLAIFNDTTYDDIQVSGFRIMTDKEIDKYEQLASSITWGFTIGDKDKGLYYSSGEEILSRIDYKEITKAEGEEIQKLFGSDFGFFITEDYLNDVASDADEDEDYYDDEDEAYENYDDE